MLQTLQLHAGGGRVEQVGGRRAGARAVDEAERRVEADVVHQLHELVEVLVLLAGEADDEVGGQADVGAHRAQLADGALVLERRVAALHGRQDAVGAVLHGQVQVVDQLGHARIGVDQALAELLRVAGGEADALDAGELGDGLQQQREVGDLRRVAHPAAVGVHVLAQQRDLLQALVGESGHLGEHVVERARHLLAARVRHHAVGAVLGAAFHHRDEGARALDAGRRQVVELLDLGEADVHLRLGERAPVGDHLGQAVQRLRAEHEVDVGRALDDGRAFLAGHAAAHADQHALRLQVLDAAEVGEHLLGGLLAHRTAVVEDEVGLLDVVRLLVAVGGVQHVCHLVGVVLVHLAAERADEDLLGHGVFLSRARARARAGASSRGR